MIQLLVIGRRHLTLLTALHLLAVSAYAQTSTSDHIDTGAQKMLGSPDVAFALGIAQDNAGGIELSGLATKKATDPDIKGLAEQLDREQTKANDQLQSMMHRANMTLPKIPGARDEAAYQRLSRLSGIAFDKAFLSAILKAQERYRKAFQKEVHRGKNQDLKNFATQTMPEIEARLEKIRTLVAQTKNKSAK